MKKVLKQSEIERKTDIEQKVKGAAHMPAPVVSFGNETVINKSVMQAKDRAQGLIDEAMASAEKVRIEAEHVLSQVEKVKADAKQEGFERGKAEGLASVTELVAKFELMKETFYETAEPDLIKLVMVIAEKVIGKIVHENESAIRSVVRQAIESSLGDRIVVKVHPDDLPHVSSESFTDALDRTRRVVFKADEAITRGGCVVETEVGTIDAQLETQLKAIVRALQSGG